MGISAIHSTYQTITNASTRSVSDAVLAGAGVRNSVVETPCLASLRQNVSGGQPGRTFHRTFILLLICLFCSLQLSAQKTQKELQQDIERARKEKEQIEKEIALIQDLIRETKAAQEESLNELVLLKKEIRLREDKLKAIRAEVNAVDAAIRQRENHIEELEQKVADLKDQYGKLLYLAYKTLANKSELFYIMSAENISQGYMRARYFREFHKYRKKQIIRIKEAKAEVSAELVLLNKDLVEKGKLLKDARDEAEKLQVRKKQLEEMYQNLNKKESKLSKELTEKQKRIKELNSTIDKLIADINKAKDKPVSKAEADKIYEMTSVFEQNKGRIPWPVPMPAGTITRKFGTHKDESGIEIQSNGVDITTQPGQVVRAVFRGEVTAVQNMPVYGTIVIISHGNYLTVYAGMEEAKVAKGDEVDALQPIGTVKTTKNGESTLHFQIFKSRSPENPESWIVGKQ